MVMIKKEDLKEGYYYLGVCRNTHVAKWENGKFMYLKKEFVWTIQDIDYFDKDSGLDGFVPLHELENPKLDKEVIDYLKKIGY